jgi:RNA polymerase primary sigma factor
MTADFPEEVDWDPDEFFFDDEGLDHELDDESEVPLLTDEELENLKQEVDSSDPSEREARDIIGQYLDEIGQYQLLSLTEEQTITRRIQTYLLAKKKKKKLQAYAEYEVDRERLMTGNLRLVVTIAKRYRSKQFSFLDLISVGNLGLNKAIDEFDPKTGFKFSTYATTVIKDRIRKSIGTVGQEIQIPIYLFDFLQRLRRVRRTLFASGIQPTEELLFEKINDDGVKEKISKERFKGLLVWERRVFSPVRLNKPVGDGDDSDEWGEFYVDNTRMSTEAEVEKVQLRETFEELLKKLAPREAIVLRLRYGLIPDVETFENLLYMLTPHAAAILRQQYSLMKEGDEDKWTLKRIGIVFGVSVEMVRQLQKQAFRNLIRHDKGTGSRLIEYLDQKQLVRILGRYERNLKE